jgi:hypothetical protein
MKNKRKYKFNSGIQRIEMDTPDYSKAYNLQAEQNAKRQGITQAAGAFSGAYKPIADVGSMAGNVIRSNNKSKSGATTAGAVEMGATGAALGMQLGGPWGAAIGGVGGAIYGGIAGSKEYKKGKLLQEEAEKKTAWDNFNKGYKTTGSETDAQAALAKKGKYKLRTKQPRLIETEGREPIFSPEKADGTRDLLYYNPNDPTHEQGGVKAMVMPKNKYNNGVNNLMPKRPANKYSLVGNSNMAYGAKQIKVNDLNNTALSSNLNGMPSANAANKFIQPTAGLSQVARQIPEARRKEKINTPRSHKKTNPDTNRIIDPPMLYEMMPPKPKSTYNTKNDFNKGGKYVKVYQAGTDGTEAESTHKHTKRFNNRQKYEEALKLHNDSLALHGQSRFFEDAVNITRKYHPTVETSKEVNKYKRTGVSKGPDPGIDPRPYDYNYGNENNWGDPQAPGFERAFSKDIHPIKTNTYTRKESTYKSKKEYEKKKDPNSHMFFYDIDMYKHPEMSPVYEADTTSNTNIKKPILKINKDTTPVTRPVKPVIVPKTPEIKLPVEKINPDTTRTTPTATPTKTTKPAARGKFVGKEKTRLQKLGEKATEFLNKIGSSKRKSNGKTVRVFK